MQSKNTSSSLDSYLERQVIALFEYLQRAGVEHVAIEHLYDFLEQEKLHPATIFERLEKNAQDAGLSLRRMKISHEEFLE